MRPLELSCSSQKEYDQCCLLIKQYGFSLVGVLDKSAALDNFIRWIELAKAFPHCDVVLHFSCNHHTIATFISLVQWWLPDNIRLLIISWATKKKRFNTLHVLKYLSWFSEYAPPVYVAHHPDAEDQEKENKWLQQKLSTFLNIQWIMMQICFDPQKILDAYQYCHKLVKDIPIYYGLLITTPRVKQSFHYKPWKWVKIPHTVLNNQWHSYDYVDDLLSIEKKDLIPYIEWFGIPDEMMKKLFK